MNGGKKDSNKKGYPPWMKPFPGFLPPIGFNSQWAENNLNKPNFYGKMN